MAGPHIFIGARHRQAKGHARNVNFERNLEAASLLPKGILLLISLQLQSGRQLAQPLILVKGQIPLIAYLSHHGKECHFTKLAMLGSFVTRYPRNVLQLDSTILAGAWQEVISSELRMGCFAVAELAIISHSRDCHRCVHGKKNVGSVCIWGMLTWLDRVA